MPTLRSRADQRSRAPEVSDLRPVKRINPALAAPYSGEAYAREPMPSLEESQGTLWQNIACELPGLTLRNPDGPSALRGPTSRSSIETLP
jgi:hypothetical protein